MSEPQFRLAPQEYDPAIPVNSISEHPANPNEGDLDLLAESLDEFGFVGAIIVHKGSGQIIAGNHRYRQAVAQGATTLPGFWVDFDPGKARAYLATDNELARRGRNNEAKLLALLKPMATLPPGYTMATVEDLAARLHPAPSGKPNPIGPGQTILVPFDSIKPYPANPRDIPSKAVEQVAKSIAEFGWQQPLVVDANRVIIIGHVRWMAAQQLQLPKVPVIIADQLTEDQVRALRVAENRSHDYTRWLYSALAGELEGLDGEFAGVLDLADWQGIIEGFQADRPELDMTNEDKALFGLQHGLTVLFDSQDSADRAGSEILKLPGVLDVRRARRAGTA